jgi:MFS family permease
MFEPSERAAIFGWYLLGPLLGPTLGPILGAIILDKLDWPWLFWIVFIICSIIVIGAFFFLQESYSLALLLQRKRRLEGDEGGSYYFEGEDDRGLGAKLSQAIRRPLKILFTQPIVLTMATYQALLFAISYSLFTQFQTIYGDGYGFTTLQVGLVFLGPGVGFLVAVRLVIPRIDTVYNHLTRKHDGQSKPEFRLPLANIGGIFIPLSMFTFAWTVQYHVHWAWSIAATFFYGIGQVSVFNSVQNYYIDAFEKYAASAIAAGALFRSVVGGIVPLFTPLLTEKLGVGWGLSVFAFLAVALAPSPLLFYRYGEWLRERFAIEL